jgi:demethylmenaquinone methyltransferase/2-methoxy-6-polyprenyl-1,4-benzoquinol methylase
MPKADYIKTMFNDISKKYDLLNDVLSLGTHRIWKKKLALMASKQQEQMILDCATGTGDIAFLIEKVSPAKIEAIDFSRKMIEKANERREKLHSKVHFQVADIEKLPFKAQQFDSSTISFGIRNVENIPQSLAELSRVSKSLYILEFGNPPNTILSIFYFSLLRLYFPIFSFISGRNDAYEYLITSSRNFPSGDNFLVLLKKHTHYKTFNYIPLFGGIAYIYQAKE